MVRNLIIWCTPSVGLCLRGPDSLVNVTAKITVVQVPHPHLLVPDVFLEIFLHERESEPQSGEEKILKKNLCDRVLCGLIPLTPKQFLLSLSGVLCVNYELRFRIRLWIGKVERTILEKLYKASATAK